MADMVINRIRILKTGLAQVERYFDMDSPEDIAYFEQLATPGTELVLKRVKNYPGDPFRIEVFSQDNRFLGRVTVAKNETAARLMDAGLQLVAVVNESLPIHDSDSSHGLSDVIDPKDPGWNQRSRAANLYTDCNLPYCIYLVDN